MTSALSLALGVLWCALIGAGLRTVRAGARGLGIATGLAGALGALTQIALALIPVGIGDSLLRIPAPDLFGGLAAAALLTALVFGVTHKHVWAPRRVPGWIALALTPVLGAAALWGAVYASTPERERERNASRRGISVPAGFKSEIFADARGVMDNPTVMTFDPRGRLWVADIDGNIWAARDADGDGGIDGWDKFADGFALLVGLVWRNGELYVSSAGKVEALRDSDGDGRADARRTLAEGLPSMVLAPHTNNSLTFGPDGRLYMGVGATVADGAEPNPRAARILSVSPDGGDVRVVAGGFGNPFDVGFNSRGDLFAPDNSNGPDDPDEFNFVRPGEDYSASGTPPLIGFAPHSTPTGMAIYTSTASGAFPAQFFDSAFVTLWNRGELVYVELAPERGGYAARPIVFAGGLLYPIDVVVGPDGALYVADFGVSVIYRISYAGG
jgi:glucose/arabinose dehydrogenase